VYYQLYNFPSCIDGACNKLRAYGWIVQSWVENFPIKYGLILSGIAQGIRGLVGSRFGQVLT